MRITSDLFHAYLKCPTKCWLRTTSELATENKYPEWVKTQNYSYRTTGVARLIAASPKNEIALSPNLKNVKTAKWRLATTIRLSLAAKRRYPFKTSGAMAAQGTHDQPNVCPSKIAMRSVLALGLLITLCASADAATVRRFKPHERHLRPTQGVTVPSVTKGFAVPGWTDEQTRYWLYNGSAAAGLG